MSVKLSSKCHGVYEKLKSRVSEHDALTAVASLRQFRVVDLTAAVTLNAADISLEHGLPMADSFVLAHARQRGESLVTLDNDFSGFQGVTLIR